jgi:DNA-binding response OmpR family regulator
MEPIAIVKIIFRRIELDKYKVIRNYIMKVSDISIDPDTRQAKFEGISIGLTGMEFSLLYYLADNRNRAISRSELLEKVWGFENEVKTRATDDMIKRVRKKLADAGSNLRIDTVRGYGFIIVG